MYYQVGLCSAAGKRKPDYSGLNKGGLCFSLNNQPMCMHFADVVSNQEKEGWGLLYLLPFPFMRKTKAFPELLSWQISFLSHLPEPCHMSSRKNEKMNLNRYCGHWWRAFATRSILDQLLKIFCHGWYLSSFMGKELKCWTTAVRLAVKLYTQGSLSISYTFSSYHKWTHHFLELK